MPVPRLMPIPRQDAYSTGATQGREGLFAALEARTYCVLSNCVLSSIRNSYSTMHSDV
ncbi:MAG: hypothetical protein F6J98_08995 [Moorea sp. SIO4G2]|nr:hypothetical protein [Moorena sp. SIO4G2]